MLREMISLKVVYTQCIYIFFIFNIFQAKIPKSDHVYGCKN